VDAVAISYYGPISAASLEKWPITNVCNINSLLSPEILHMAFSVSDQLENCKSHQILSK